MRSQSKCLSQSRGCLPRENTSSPLVEPRPFPQLASASRAATCLGNLSSRCTLGVPTTNHQVVRTPGSCSKGLERLPLQLQDVKFRDWGGQQTRLNEPMGMGHDPWVKRRERESRAAKTKTPGGETRL